MPTDIELCGRTLHYQAMRARTGDGVEIAIQDHGAAAELPPGARDLLFLHGFSQSSLCWLKQVTGDLRTRHRLVTCDLRGHGASDKPLDPLYYRDSARWADEVATVIATTELRRPVIVCWSYAGRIALDFLRHAGPDAIGGLVMVAATSTVKDGVLGPATPLLRAMAGAPDSASNLAATSALLRACTTAPMPAEEFALTLATNLMTPPAVRAAMSGRVADYDDVLRAIRVPALLIHGDEDLVNMPAMSDHSQALLRDGMLHVYRGCGHLPFWEAADRFDTDLADYLARLD